MKIKKFYPSGALKMELTYRNGVLHGTARQFYENGRLQIDMKYENGIPNGAYALYYAAGNPQIVATLKDGRFYGQVQRYKGDGTPIDSTAYENAAGERETAVLVVSGQVVPWEICFKEAIRSSLGLLMTETAWAEGFTCGQNAQEYFIPIKQWRTPEQAGTELQNGQDTLLVTVNRSPWSDPVILSSGCSKEEIGFDLASLVKNSVEEFRLEYHDTLEYAGLLRQGYGFSITRLSSGRE